jgi:hypothetical protein
VYYDPPNPADSPIAFLDSCPITIQARFDEVLEAVRMAPPPQFSGGGFWEAMHGGMGGYYEVRLTGPGREQFRLFCILERPGDQAERDRTGLPGPVIAVIAGMRKPHRTVFGGADYRHVRDLGEAYRRTFPRKIVT